MLKMEVILKLIEICIIYGSGLSTLYAHR